MLFLSQQLWQNMNTSRISLTVSEIHARKVKLF